MPRISINRQQGKVIIFSSDYRKKATVQSTPQALAPTPASTINDAIRVIAKSVTDYADGLQQLQRADLEQARELTEIMDGWPLCRVAQNLVDCAEILTGRDPFEPDVD